MNRKSGISVFLRYALSYIGVLMLLFLSISVYLFFRLSAQVRQELIDNQINRLTRIADQHESYLTAMVNTAEEIDLRPDMEFFRYDEEPWRAYELQQQLVPYTTTSTFCDQVYLHFFGDDRIYSSSASLTVEMFARLMRYEFVPMERLVSILESTDRLTVLPAQKVSSTLVDTSRVVTFLVPMGGGQSGKGLLIYLLKDSVYQSLLFDAIEEQQNTYIFQGTMKIVSSGSLPLSEEGLTGAWDGTSRTFRREGEDWTQVSLTGRNWGLTYTAVMRDAEIGRMIARQLSSLLALLPVFVAGCLLLALWMARRHAQPIQELSGMLTPEGPETRRDELQQISTGIRRLTTRNQELATRLTRALPLVRHDFVFAFVKGRFATREEAVAAGRAAGMEIDRPFYAVILCAGADPSGHPFDLSRPPFAPAEGFCGAGVELVALNASLYLVFADREETLYTLAEQLREECAAAGSGSVTAISAPHTDFDEASAAYLEAAAAYDNRFVPGDRQVLAYTDLSPDEGDILPQARKLTLGISQALSLHSRQLLDGRMDDLLHFLKNTHMSPFAFRMIYNDVINTLIHTHAVALSDEGSALDLYNIFSLATCQSIDDLDEMLRRLCGLLMSGGGKEAQQEEDGEDEISQAARYMEEHFSDPEISITALADSFDLSVTRFSTGFKEKMGMSPLDYLTLMRVERARRLLATTDLPIREISLRAGYYDSGSFIRRFKQVTGETPLQYRRARENGTGEEN